MTDAQAAWLRKLRDEGPHVAYLIGKTGCYCRRNGWAGLAALTEHERVK